MELDLLIVVHWKIAEDVSYIYVYKLAYNNFRRVVTTTTTVSWTLNADNRRNFPVLVLRAHQGLHCRPGTD